MSYIQMIRMRRLFLSLMRKLLLIGLLIGLCSCQSMRRITNPPPALPEPKYVASVNDDAKFTVIPFNDYMNQIEFAAYVESVLLKAGLNLVAAPRGTKMVEKRKGAGVVHDSDASSESNARVQREEIQATSVEKYITNGEINTDYIVETMLIRYKGTVKFTRIKDAKIMGVFTVSADDSDHLRKDIFDALEDMHFIVRTQNDVNP